MLKAAGKALKGIHAIGGSHGQVNLEHLVTNAEGKISLKPFAPLLAQSVGTDESLKVMEEDRAWDMLVSEFIPPEARHEARHKACHSGESSYGPPSASGDMWQLGVSLLCMI